MPESQKPEPNESITVVLPYFDRQPALTLFLVPGGEPDLATGEKLYEWFTSAEEWTPEEEHATMTELATSHKLADEYCKMLQHFLNQGGNVWPKFIRPSPNTIPIMARDLAAYVFARYGPPVLPVTHDDSGTARMFIWFTTLDKGFNPDKLIRGRSIWHDLAAEDSEDELAAKFAEHLKEHAEKGPIPAAYAEIPVMARDLARYVKTKYSPAKQ